MLQKRPHLPTVALVLAALALVVLLALAPARSTAQETEQDPYAGPAAELPPVPLPTVVPPGAGPPIAGPPLGPPLELVTEVVSLVTVETSTTEAVEASTTTDDGSTAEVVIPAGALPEGATVEIAEITNIEEIIAQAPVATFADVDLVVSFSFTATSSEGAPIEQFSAPIAIDLTVEPESIAADADLQDIVIAFWNGFTWVILHTTATLNADGSLNLAAETDHFTVFVILQLRPTVFDVPPAGTLAQGIAGTNDPARLASVQTSPVESMFGVFANQWVAYIPGAPALVNTLTSEIMTPDTPLIVRFLNLTTSAASTAE